MTIGWFGRERVDYLTYDTNGIWRCYEIKVTKSDFHSKANNTFIGHFNYYVMPDELYEVVKDEIPKHIGVHNGLRCIKNAKKQMLGIEERILSGSMIRSLFRDADKHVLSRKPNVMDFYKRENQRLQRDVNRYREQYFDMRNEVIARYGTRWDKGEILQLEDIE